MAPEVQSRPFAMQRLSVITLLTSIALIACGQRSEINQNEQAARVPRECTKDIVWLEDLMAAAFEPISCDTDADCADCGTHCDPSGFCIAQCITTDHPSYPCHIAGEQCDNWGECVDPTADPLPVVVPQLTVTPLAIEVPALPAGTPHAPYEVQVTLALPGVVAGQAPVVTVAGASTRRPACAEPTCPMETVQELEVRCAETAAWTDECQLDGAWDWQPAGAGHTAVRPIWVRPRADAQATSWDLRLIGDGTTATDESVTITRAVSTLQPFDGQYTGRLTLTAVDGAAPTTIAVEAIAAGTRVLLLDPTRAFAPLGRLPVDAAGARVHVPWLTSGDGEVIARLDVTRRDHQPATGALDADLVLTLPIGGDGRLGAPTTGAIDASLHLQRIGAGAARACTAGCELGTTCEPVIGRCLPGPTWQASTSTMPINAMSSPLLDAWSAAIRPYLTPLLVAPAVTTADTVERLACYRPGMTETQSKNAVFGPSAMLKSGDLACAQDTTAPWTARATVQRDSGTGPITVGQLLSNCLADLAETIPSAVDSQTFEPSTCISLARLLPGLDVALEHALDDDGSHVRPATLAQSLVRQWVTVHAFVTSQGNEHEELAAATNGSAPVALAELLATAERGWNVLLSAPVSQVLASLEPRHLRDPDYRGTSQPVMYWPGTSGGDVAGGDQPIATSSGCCPRGSFCDQESSCDADQSPVVDPSELDLTGDLTLAFRSNIDATEPNRIARRIVTSPWLRVELDFAGAAYREENVRRSTAMMPTPIPYVRSWMDCRHNCTRQSNCHAWTWNDALDQCYSFQSTTGTRSTATGWYSGVVRAENSVPSAVPGGWLLHQPGVAAYSGTAVSTTTGGSFINCFDACSRNASCRYINYTASNAQCVQLSSIRPLNGLTTVDRAQMPSTYLTVSHVTATGATERLRFLLPRAMAGEDLVIDRKFVVTRTAADRTYRLYMNGQPIAQATYTKAPGRPPGRVRVGRRDAISGAQRALFEAASDVALWRTALDPTEILTMATRAGSQPLWRGAYVEPVDPDHDQSIGLPVTMLEGAAAHLQLAAQEIEEAAATADAVCHGEADAALLEPARVRAGTALRQSMAVEQLANELSDRAALVACERDAQCAPSGGRCGLATRQHVDAMATAVTTSGMSTCNAFVDETGVPQGLCGTGSTVVTSPGTGGTATFRFTAPVAGPYRLWGRVFAVTGRQSFWFRVDGGAWRLWTTGVSSTAPYRWHWSATPLDATGAPTAQLTAGEHVIDVSVREPNTVLDELVLVGDSRDRAPDELRDFCSVDGAYVRAPLPWAADLQEARDVVAANRGRLIEDLGSMGTCTAPFGIPDDAAPLYFADPGPSAFARYFAASQYLLGDAADPGLARYAVASARGALDDATAAWNAMQEQQYQADVTDLDRQTRLEGIRGEYDAQLGRLCGNHAQVSGSLLTALASELIDPSVCFVEPTAACLADAQRPARDASPACYSGQLGEALVTMKGAAIDVDAARREWTARQDDLGRKAKYCAELEQTGDMIRKHNEHMETLRRRKARFDMIAGWVAFGAGLSSGGLGVLAAKDNWEPNDAGKLAPWQVRVEDANDLLGMFAGGVSLLGNLLPGADMAAEQAKWDALMQARSNELAVMQCWDQASAMRDQIGIAQNRIERATTDFEAATLRFVNGRREVTRLVEAGSAEVARDENRRIPRPQHQYWLDEKVTAHHRKLAWAKRLTYLAVRAAEHDLQRSTGLRDDTLAAQSAFDLETIIDALDPPFVSPRVCGKIPQSGQLVARATALAGLAPGGLGAYLATDAAIIRDRRGVEIGRGIRFRLAPDSAAVVQSGLATRAAERLWAVSGSVQVDGTVAAASIPFAFFKHRSFYSRWCGEPDGDGDEFQHGTNWPAENLFDLDGEDIRNFTEAQVMQACTVDNLKNLTDAELRAVQDPTALPNDFAGQGVFGEYVLLFRTQQLETLDVAHIEDVVIRLDHVSVENGSTPGSL